MKRIETVLVALALTLVLGACASDEAAMKAPSSAAYEKMAAADEAAAAGSAAQAGDAATAAEQEHGRPAMTGTEPAATDEPREQIVQTEPEPRVAPIVPAFPARMQQKILVDLETVFFRFDSADLSAETKQVLDKNVGWIKAHAQLPIRLIGHADERGTSEYNLGLGMRRANQVRTYLIGKGVSADALTTVSYGEEMPLRRGHNEEAWRMNRRVEFSRAEATARR